MSESRIFFGYEICEFFDILLKVNETLSVNIDVSINILWGCLMLLLYIYIYVYIYIYIYIIYSELNC